MRPSVVLAPGLWMPTPVMWLLAARLEAAGYATQVFSYSGRASHEANVEALARFAGKGGAFVGHSLGGVLVLDMLSRHPEIEARAVVLLGAPLGVIAGTLPLGLARAFGALPGSNDGVVCVDETSVEGMADRALVRCGHSMLITSRPAARLVERFLGAGRFA